MALLNEAVDFKKLDIRMVERNVNRGVLTQDEVDTAISQLPDDAENAEVVDLDALIDQVD